MGVIWTEEQQKVISLRDRNILVSAAAESTMTTSTAPERTNASQISSACSPLSGWETKSSLTSTPSFAA